MSDTVINFDSKHTPHIGHLGITGSGKTVFAKGFTLRHFGRRIVIDPEQEEFIDPPYVKATSKQALKAASKPGYFALRIPWSVKGEQTDDELEQFLRGLLKIRDPAVAIYFDELSMFVGPNQIGRYLKAVMVQGRHHRINVVWSTQRPQLINRTIWTQTNHLFSFFIDEYDITGPGRGYMKFYANDARWPAMGTYRSLYRAPDRTVWRLERLEA